MKKFLTVLFLTCAVAVVSSTLIGCTPQSRAKNWGGKATINLPRGQKLVTATWKENEIWYLTKPMSSNDVAETYTFKESSSFGIIEGSVIFIEAK